MFIPVSCAKMKTICIRLYISAEQIYNNYMRIDDMCH